MQLLEPLLRLLILYLGTQRKAVTKSLGPVEAVSLVQRLAWAQHNQMRSLPLPMPHSQQGLGQQSLSGRLMPSLRVMLVLLDLRAYGLGPPTKRISSLQQQFPLFLRLGLDLGKIASRLQEQEVLLKSLLAFSHLVLLASGRSRRSLLAKVSSDLALPSRNQPQREQMLKHQEPLRKQPKKAQLQQ